MQSTMIWPMFCSRRFGVSCSWMSTRLQSSADSVFEFEERQRRKSELRSRLNGIQIREDSLLLDRPDVF
jgi:hypothetical protein